MTSSDAREGHRIAASRRRLTGFGVALTLHLLILALFLGGNTHTTLGKGLGAGAMDVSLAGLSRMAAPTPRPAAPPKAPAPHAAPGSADPIRPRSVLAIVSDILAIPLPQQTVTPTPLAASPSPVVAKAIAQASGSVAAACDIAGAVQTALSADADASGAPLLVAPSNRSAANAVMVWNGQWIAPTDVGGAGVHEGLRTAIRRIVAAAPPDCRDREIVGPRFMIIPVADTTVVMVFGNASWRWSDLLVDDAGSSTPPTKDEKKVLVR